MATTTIGIYLAYRTPQADADGTPGYQTITEPYKKVADIRSIPAMFSTPNTIDTTTMSNLDSETNELGLSPAEAAEFTALYRKEDFIKVQRMKRGVDIENGTTPLKDGNMYDWALIIPSDGSVFQWKGSVVRGLNGAGVQEALEMTITTSKSKEPILNETVKTITPSADYTSFQLA